MIGFISRLFGAPDAVGSIIDNVSNGLDKLVYTDEEKAEAAANERREARAMVVNWMESTKGQNIARRLIALCITAVWLLMYMVSVLSNMVAVWWVSAAEQLNATGDIGLQAAADMNPAVMLILAFYFAAPHMGSIATAAIERMGGSNRGGNNTAGTG